MLKLGCAQLSETRVCTTLIPWNMSTSSRSLGAGASSLIAVKPKLSNNSGRRQHRADDVRRLRVKAVTSRPDTTSSEVATSSATKAKATVSVQVSGGILRNMNINHGLDDVADLLGKSILLEIISSDLDSESGVEKETIKGYARKKETKDNIVKYECEFVVPKHFGEIGAILVENEHHTEMFVKDILIDQLEYMSSSVHISCESFVASKFNNPEKRIFFTNKAYLPSKTPEGLKRLREQELEKIRGNGQGKRKSDERIYDYDVYNDLGNPDKDGNQKRPVLGGKQNPYPRRCRTGRSKCKNDPASESPSATVNYVPRDEAFSNVKSTSFSVNTVSAVLHTLLPSLETSMIDSKLGFPYFTAIDTLFNEGIHVPDLKSSGNWIKDTIPRVVKFASTIGDNVLLFETPQIHDRDRFAWFRDEEFSRQTVAGINPLTIELVKEWPMKSKLDPNVYGPPESAITKEVVEKEIRGFLTVEQAIKEKKLFVLDYHDILMPYVNKVREIDGTTLYGSRTLFFLMPEGVLRPLAIELVVPPSEDGKKPQWKKVYTPHRGDSTACWLWRLAKAHVVAHDSGIHQLVSHWLRTHCCVEPYILSTHRQLSAAHPIYKLLHPHFRYTMEINALARNILINSDGIIESTFFPRKYSLELSSAAYNKLWRFDHEALPANLISRGLAVEDPSAPHGLKLAIEDYPYANDGLLIWDAIKQWVTDYVNFYYTETNQVKDDTELQAWWKEIITVGHGDKSEETWWPLLNTPDDLIGILTTMIWVPSGHHAAVNFGQYPYGGYFPNRPSIARTKMPSEMEDSEYWKHFIERPEGALLQCFPSQIQATKVMAVYDALSNHCVDEEYLGEKIEPSWAEEGVIKAAFERFYGKLKEIEGIIDGRNVDPALKHRSGAGVLPYELLKPFSEAGVTGMGVPNSISI